MSSMSKLLLKEEKRGREENSEPIKKEASKRSSLKMETLMMNKDPWL